MLNIENKVGVVLLHTSTELASQLSQYNMSHTLPRILKLYIKRYLIVIVANSFVILF